MPHAHFCLAILVALLWSSANGDDPLPAADPAVTRAELEHHVRFLASDELGGRAPLTAGMERAAQYLARALAAAGAEPAGEEGTFFQNTPLKRYDVPVVPRLLFWNESGAVVEAQYGADFSVRIRGTAHATEKLPLRFFYDYNHERMPLKGNPAEALYFSGGKTQKQRILEEKGIANLEDWGLELTVLMTDKGKQQGQRKESFPARFVTEPAPEGCELVELRGPLLEDFERKRFTHVQLLIDEVLQPFQDRNVVGRIRGAGTSERPELAKEVVILSAHYDHLGSKEAPRGRDREDSLFNGADDDASGCAALLELAQAFASGAKPARTLVFLFTTGEESGGVGTRRYLANPAEPLAQTVADLNLEMLGRPDELVGGSGQLWLTGPERTNLGYLWEIMDFKAIHPDPRPKEMYFERSDNYAFALEGIVAQSLSSFGGHKDYHSPRDEADTLDYAHLEAAARLALRAATTLADGSVDPTWVQEGQPKKAVNQPRHGPRTEEERAAERDRRRAEREHGDGGEEEGAEGDDDG